MRVAPVALFATGDIARTLDLARRSALVTHTHQLAVDGAVAQAFAVASALRPGVAGELSVSRPMQEQFDRVESMPSEATPDDVAFGIGHGIDALSSVPAARAVVRLAGDSMVEAMRYALAIGGDTDTIASMAGAVVGARLGADAIPEAWLDRLEGKDQLIELADKLVAVSA
jgi:poly(ADP-ribose) glycohydrolase ARH3